MPTTPDRPAGQLRAAAEKLRAVSSAASAGPWTIANIPPYTDPVLMSRYEETPADGEVLIVGNVDVGEEDQAQIALMHPGVGLAVARWLESWSGVDLSEHGPMPEDAQHALAVARQLLGTTSETTAAPPAPADRAAEAKAATTITRLRAERAELNRQLDCLRGDMRDMETSLREQDAEFERIRRAAGEAAAGAHQTEQAQPDDIQVWPLTRVLTEVRCGSQDWAWDEEWADLDKRHAETGYLDRLEQQIRANGITMPVLIGSDGRLWDGHHRLRIAVRLGIGYVPVEITPPAAPTTTEADAEPPTEEQIIREHVTSVHLLGEQLAGVESWLWQRLADARDTATPAVPAAPEETQ